MARQAKQAATAKEKGGALEFAIQQLERAILKQSPSFSEKTIRFEPKKIIIAAGVRHELDISVSVDLGGGYESTFIFECKNWKDKVSKNDIIIFSEKIDVAQAQKGFFVARAFTRDATAQAKKDPRVQLLRVRELDDIELPDQLRYFHTIDQTVGDLTCNIKLKVDRETGEQEKVDELITILTVNGKEMTVSEYARAWQVETATQTVNKFGTAFLANGTYKLPLEEVQHFRDGECLVDGKPVASITLTSGVEVGVFHAVVESRYEVENRGRVYTVVCVTPKFTVRMTAHELMAGMLPSPPVPSELA